MTPEMEKTSRDLPGTLERLDKLLSATRDEERMRSGLGIRLALGMAEELRQGLPLGKRTAVDVAAWTEEFGRDTVDAAVAIAREFLTKPRELRMALGQKLKELGALENQPALEGRTDEGSLHGLKDGPEDGLEDGLENGLQDGSQENSKSALDHALEPGSPA